VTDTESTVFIIRPHRGGWQCFEAPGVVPYFTGADARGSAIRYAQGRTAHRFGEIRVYNAAGELEETIAFDERARKL
jgi:hypothetical protein